MPRTIIHQPWQTPASSLVPAPRPTIRFRKKKLRDCVSSYPRTIRIYWHILTVPVHVHKLQRNKKKGETGRPSEIILPRPKKKKQEKKKKGGRKKRNNGGRKKKKKWRQKKKNAKSVFLSRPPAERVSSFESGKRLRCRRWLTRYDQHMVNQHNTFERAGQTKSSVVRKAPPSAIPAVGDQGARLIAASISAPQHSLRFFDPATNRVSHALPHGTDITPFEKIPHPPALGQADRLSIQLSSQWVCGSPANRFSPSHPRFLSCHL